MWRAPLPPRNARKPRRNPRNKRQPARVPDSRAFHPKTKTGGPKAARFQVSSRTSSTLRSSRSPGRIYGAPPAVSIAPGRTKGRRILECGGLPPLLPPNPHQPVSTAEGAAKNSAPQGQLGSRQPKERTQAPQRPPPSKLPRDIFRAARATANLRVYRLSFRGILHLFQFFRIQEERVQCEF